MADHTLVDVVVDACRNPQEFAGAYLHPHETPLEREARATIAAIRDALSGPDGERYAVELGLKPFSVASGTCSCRCHTSEGVKHFVACCSPTYVSGFRLPERQEAP